MIFLSRHEDDTAARAAALAPLLRPRDVVFLEGTLGMGKSVFARALIRTLCGQPDLDVPSPTFTLVQTYDTAAGPLWHFDLYRIRDPEEIYELGWEDARSEGIVLVEWASKLTPGLAPRDRLEIGLTPSSQHQGARDITLTLYGQWKDRL